MRLIPLFLLCPTTIWAQNASITGTVRNEISGAPIGRAEVRIFGQTAQLVARTDAGGRFSAQGLSPGRYSVAAVHPDYPTNRVRQSISVDVTQTDGKYDLSIQLRPCSSISGRVLDEEGEPVYGASVEILREQRQAGEAALNSYRTVQTDDQGQFRLSRIAPGWYWMRAGGGRGEPPPRPFGPPPPPGEPEPSLQHGIYYPDAEDLQQAGRLHLTAGQSLEGVELRLRPLRGVIVQGAVEPPLESSMVRLIPRDPRLQSVGLRMNGTNPQTGRFLLGSVSPGSYWLVAAREDPSNRMGSWEPLEIGEAALGPIAIKLQPAARLEGTLEWNGHPVPLASGTQIHLNSAISAAGLGYASGKISDGGAFAVEGILPGLWQLGVSPLPPNVFVKSVWIGNQEVNPREMMIQPGGSGPVRILLSPNGPTIEGQVEDVLPQSGTSRGPFAVLAIPSKADPHFFRPTAMVQPDGSFRLEGLRPGEYRLYAGQVTADLSDRLVLEELADKAQTVRISEGEKANVRLKLIPMEAVEEAWRKIE